MAAEWFYTLNRQQRGPVYWRELRELAESGVLKPDDMVWSEGMTDWVKALDQAGLFAHLAAAEPIPEATAYVEAKPAPSRRMEEDEEEREPRRRKRRRERSGSGAGLKIGMIVAGVLVVLLLLGCVGAGLIWMVVALGAGDQRHEYTINNLPPGGHNERQFEFKRGTHVVITVDSTVTHPATDVDLFVSRGPNDVVASDQRKEKDCRVEFIVPATGFYRVAVVNLGPGMARTCQVTITEK